MKFQYSQESWYSSGLWLSALDQNGSLKTAAYLYGTGNDFYAGQLDQSGSVDGATCSASDRIFRMDRMQVDVFRNLFNEPGFVIDQDILEWPATGNPNADFDGGAPFVDVNGDLMYNALDGDYPAFSFDGNVDMDYNLLGNQCLWYVINDVGSVHTQSGGDPLAVQVHCMAYAFDCTELEHQSFYRYSITNKGSNDLLETSIGLFADPDIGNANDDFVQCDVARNMGFGFNGDQMDGTDGTGAGEYSGIPPAAGLDLLQGPLADANDGLDNDNDGIIDESGERIGMWRFMSIRSAGSGPPYSSEPTSSSEYHQYLNGFWRDGAPSGYGGNGHPSSGSTIDARYMYPGNSDPLGYGTSMVSMPPWDEINSNNPLDDRRFLMSTGNFSLLQSVTKHIHVGALWAKDDNGSTSYSSVEKLETTSDTVQMMFDGQFQDIGCCLANANFIQVLVDGTTVYFAPTQTATTYFWDFGDGSTSTEQFPNHDFGAEGSYEVCLTVTGSCGVETSCQTIDVVWTGVDEDAITADLLISPNPSNGQFSVSHPSLQSVQIFGSDGRLVISENVFSASHEVNISSQAKGIYLVVATIDNEKLTAKVVVR
jgi:hypothetical protein